MSTTHTLCTQIVTFSFLSISFQVSEQDEAKLDEKFYCFYQNCEYDYDYIDSSLDSEEEGSEETSLHPPSTQEGLNEKK